MCFFFCLMFKICKPLGAYSEHLDFVDRLVDKAFVSSWINWAIMSAGDEPFLNIF